MKIAIFHDYIDCIGGGEKLVLMLAKALNADIITTDFNKDAAKKMNADVNIINLGNTIKRPPFKQIHTSLKFALCNFTKKYDFFIFSGNWSIFAAFRHKPNLWYCHTPVRVFYDLYEDMKKSLPPFKRFIFVAYTFFHSFFVQKCIKHIEKIVTNSLNTKRRIRRYHKRNAIVVYPPIKTSLYKFKKNGNFWLSVSRLYPHKRIELQLEAFRRLPNEKLVVVGWHAQGDHSEKYVKKILKNVPENVEFLGNVSEKKLARLYGECKAFIATSKNEDFGMTPLEAMAAGKPVVAVNEGGYKESVLNGKTGLLVKANVNAITKAIKKINSRIASRNAYAEACMKRAKLFDEKIFIEKMKKIIQLR